MLTRIALALAILMAAPAVRAADAAPKEPVRYTYRVVGDDSLAAYVFAPPVREGKVPGILLFHGGGWVAGSAEWVFASAARFAEWGMVAIAIDYRLSEGDVTPIDALDDVCASFEWARANAEQFGMDERVAGYGVSAGGHLVTATVTVGCKGSVNGPDALLLWSPALNLADDGWFAKLLKGGRASDYSPLEHVGKSTPPTSIVNGAADTLTPASGAKQFCEKLTAAGVTCDLNVYEGVGHLLTRNLANQEDDFDPDPEKRALGIESQRKFLVRLGYIKDKK